MSNPLLEKYLEILHDTKKYLGNGFSDLLCNDFLAYLYCIAQSDNNIDIRELLYINQIITKISDNHLVCNHIRTISEFKEYLSSACPNVTEPGFTRTPPKSYIAIANAEQQGLLPVSAYKYSDIYYDTLLIIGNELIFSDHQSNILELKKWIDYISTLNIYRQKNDV